MIRLSDRRVDYKIMMWNEEEMGDLYTSRDGIPESQTEPGLFRYMSR
jgi:hypothetical protein